MQKRRRQPKTLTAKRAPLSGRSGKAGRRPAAVRQPLYSPPSDGLFVSAELARQHRDGILHDERREQRQYRRELLGRLAKPDSDEELQLVCLLADTVIAHANALKFSKAKLRLWHERSYGKAGEKLDRIPKSIRRCAKTVGKQTAAITKYWFYQTKTRLERWKELPPAARDFIERYDELPDLLNKYADLLEYEIQMARRMYRFKPLVIGTAAAVDLFRYVEDLTGFPNYDAVHELLGWTCAYYYSGAEAAQVMRGLDVDNLQRRYRRWR